MASNEAEKLRKQIDVLSSLIDSHKELKVKENDSKRNYSWNNTRNKNGSKTDSNNTRKCYSFKTDNTSKQSISSFNLERRKHTSANSKPLVCPATASSSAVPITRSDHSKKGKNPLNKCGFDTSESEWKKKCVDINANSRVSTVKDDNDHQTSSKYSATSLSARLSSLSSSIAAAKLKLQESSNISSVYKEGSSGSLLAKSSHNLPSSAYSWTKNESEPKTTNTQSISNPSSVLKWTRERGKEILPKIKVASSVHSNVWRAKGSLKLDRRKRSSVRSKQMSSGGFMKCRQKVVQKDTSKKNVSSRFHLVNSKRRGSAGSEKKSKVKIIEGIPYKTTTNKLQKQSQVKSKIPSKKAKLKSSKMLNISGNKYLMDATRRSLKRVQPDKSQPSTSKAADSSSKRRSSLNKVVVGGTAFTKTSSGVHSPGSRSLSSHVRRRSVQNALLYKYRKNAKSQQYCMFYNRFGKCNKGDKCPYIHDPSKIAVCTKFLQGKCKKTDGSCSFSHKIDKDKLPVCQFFLKDTCTNDNCPYSHVNVSSNAAVCQDFIKGYCPDGQQCKKKHILDCEEFLLTGKCTKGKKCNLMHRVQKPRKRKQKSSSKDSQQNVKQAKVEMTEEEGFLPLQSLDEPMVKESSDARSKERVQAIAIKPRFLISKDSEG